MELRIQELTESIKNQKWKILNSFSRLLPEKELLQELITNHLEFTKFKKQEIETNDYDEKCEEYEDKFHNLKKKLRTKLNKETMNEVSRILTDCEDLTNQEIELEKKLQEKTPLIEEQKKLLKITDCEKERAIVQKNENITQKQAEELQKLKEQMANLEGQLVMLNINKIILAEDLPSHIYQLSLNFLKNKDYFYLARKNTISNLQTQIQTLENKIKNIEKGTKVSELMINIGNSTKNLDQGITSAVGSSLKAGTNLLSSTYVSQEGKKIHLTFQNSEEEFFNIQNLDFAYSQLNSALNGDRDQDLFGLLDNRYHSAFKIDYHIYDILNKQINVWPDRKLNQERLEQIYQTLQNNLTQLNEEINSEFLKLKPKDQTNIRKDNELKIENNQVKIVDKNQRIEDLESQINIRKEELQNLINLTKEKLKNKFSDKKTKERHDLFDQFLKNDSAGSALITVARKERLNLQLITDNKNLIKKIQKQLNDLQLENQVVQLDINK
ncbi:MAG: hypothetical protein mread185_000716 [Mycoplasmataceae bacterium]|nr:MAG: hypothetical protein mread185_000716 [Mycoplasmataceae bacterium]